MKIVFIGGSGHYGFALPTMAARPDLQAVGLAKGCPQEDLTNLARCLPGLTPDEDYRVLLDREKPDLAVVSPWYCLNSQVAIECLSRGVHVFCEKPLATTLDDLAALTACWKQSGRALGAMFNLRGAPWFLAIRQAIEAGEIGTVRLLHGQKSYRMGVREEFFHRRELYGGMLPWVGIHAIDWVLQLGGRCEWLSASQSRLYNRGQGELETSAALLMRLENQVIATVTADYLRPDGSARHDDDRLRVTGTRGMLEAVDGRVYLENEQPRRELELPPAQDQFAAFLDAIASGSTEEWGASALESSRVSLLARLSGDEGRAIETISSHNRRINQCESQE